ncbi:MAG: hypothetical protein CMN67_03970 [Sphingomonadaceae bacterium]|nr:hypothetical protein [Sphingomonadaceae bacterium]|tara:strand:- start:3311 stop:4774 length:1464 start_codon:yes stop_codon:yes gene_type:complete
MSFHLSDLKVLGDGVPSFAIPIFSKIGSNRSFTHDLDTEGRVVRFIEFDDQFFRSAYIPNLPPLKVDLGEFGLFTLVDERDIIFQGNLSDLKAHFEDQCYDNSIIEIEAANLLGDRDRLSKALGSFRWVQNDNAISSKWAAAERRTFSKLRNIREGTDQRKAEKSSDLEPEFDRLKAFPETDDWSRTWINLWQQDFRRDALVKLAGWRVDAGYEPQRDGALVYIRALEGSRDADYTGKYSLKWLKSAPLSFVNWLKLAVALWSRKQIRFTFDEVVQSKLEDELASKDFSAPAWRRTWQFAWSRLKREDQLENMADQYFEIIHRLALPDGEMLLYLLRNPQNIERFYDHAVTWLIMYPRSTLVWADLFIAAFNFERSGALIEVGREWLATQGGATNRWRMIWEMFEPIIGRQEHTELGFDWLFRSRADLRSWTQVYSVIAFRVTDTWRQERLIEISGHWFNIRYPWHRDYENMRKITQHLRSALASSS